METKNLFYILLSILVFSFGSCTDDEKIEYIKKDQLPEAVHSFLGEYLPNNKFISASNVGFGTIIYSVKLEQDIAVEFNSEGNWLNMQSEKGLPETVKGLLSENSRNELSEQHGTDKVLNMIKRFYDEIEIVLDNSKTYYEIIGHEGKTLAEVLNEEGVKTLPEKMKDFMTQYLNINTRTSPVENELRFLKFSGFKGIIYRFRFSFDVFVDFNEDGEWFYMKEARIPVIIEQTLIKAIPEEVIATLKKEEPNAIASIQKITRFDDNKIYGFNKLYGFTFGDNQFILINSENQIVEPPLDKAKEYIKKAFNPQKEFQYKINSNTISPYFLRYSFKVSGLAEDILLVTDVYGNMRDISAGPITTEAGKTIALPRAVLDMLPKAIVNYFDANYSGKEVIHIYHSYSKIGDVPPTVNLTMPIPNNLKTLVFDTGTGQYIREFNTIGEQE